jgi:hypothetical protein
MQRPGCIPISEKKTSWQGALEKKWAERLCHQFWHECYAAEVGEEPTSLFVSMDSFSTFFLVCYYLDMSKYLVKI